MAMSLKGLPSPLRQQDLKQNFHATNLSTTDKHGGWGKALVQWANPTTEKIVSFATLIQAHQALLILNLLWSLSNE